MTTRPLTYVRDRLLWVAVVVTMLPAPLAHAVSATDPFTVAGQTAPSPTNPSAAVKPTYQQLLASGFNIFLWIATAAAVFYLIYNGFTYITAGGDAEKATKARSGLVSAIIGIILLVAVYFIFNAARGVGASPTDSSISGL